MDPGSSNGLPDLIQRQIETRAMSLGFDTLVELLSAMDRNLRGYPF